MKDLIICGTGGFAREMHQIVEDLNRDRTQWNFLGFLDDNPARHGTLVHDLPVLGDTSWLEQHPEVAVAIGIGNTAVRRKMVARIQAMGPRAFATLVHPLAWVGNRVQVGEGTTICAGCLITTDIEIRDHVILNLDCTVGHDAVLEDFVTVAPSVNISGNVRVETGCDLGTGSTIIQGLTLGAWSILGAGSVAVRDLPPNVTAVGVPAKVIKERPAGWHEA